MSKTLFITGGSGYIGTRIITYAKVSYTIRALSRSETSDAHLRSLGATPIRGDLSNLNTLTSEAKNADVVIAIADSIASSMGTMSMEERFKINRAAIEALGTGLANSSRESKTLVLTSGTLQAAANADGTETNESSPAWPDAPFGVGVEDSGLAFADKGVKVNVVRLAPWVYGHGGSGIKRFMQGCAATGEMVYIGDGSSCTSTVHVDDAARLFLLVADKAGKGEVYNCTGETGVTFKQLAQAIGEAVGVPVVSKSYEEMEKAMGAFFAKFLSLENRAGSGKAKEDLGWKVQVEKGALDEIKKGSYVEVARDLKKSNA